MHRRQPCPAVRRRQSGQRRTAAGAIRDHDHARVCRRDLRRLRRHGTTPFPIGHRLFGPSRSADPRQRDRPPAIPPRSGQDPQVFGVRRRIDDHHPAAGAARRQELPRQRRRAPRPGRKRGIARPPQPPFMTGSARRPGRQARLGAGHPAQRTRAAAHAAERQNNQALAGLHGRGGGALAEPPVDSPRKMTDTGANALISWHHWRVTRPACQNHHIGGRSFRKETLSHI